MNKYLIYENLYDEDWFMIFFNKDTPDYEKAIDFYYSCIIYFVKWDKNFGKIKSGKTPFRKNLV